eukprot:TRINITY_DN2772_c0_g1_i4.p3 TRINITY_DN2772_c0_g1~~TRINITY_DN2772_c0_g1_i4.p3  ORF type:complete len:207 (-),score=56.43 TRINITY_DN2772_c0_g1_i4:389-952(-)
MIVQHMAALNGKRIVLASGSPRRREILTMLGLAHEVHVSAFEENLDKATFPTPADYAKTNAASKAAAVVAGLVAGGGGGQGPDLVIGSDTIVVVDGRILEKPRSEAAAFDMLSSLSGQEHSVLSAVALFTPSRSEVRDKPASVFCEHTRYGGRPAGAAGARVFLVGGCGFLGLGCCTHAPPSLGWCC